MYRPLFVEVDVEGIKRQDETRIRWTGSRESTQALAEALRRIYPSIGRLRIVGGKPKKQWADVYECGKPGPVRRVRL